MSTKYLKIVLELDLIGYWVAWRCGRLKVILGKFQIVTGSKETSNPNEAKRVFYLQKLIYLLLQVRILRQPSKSLINCCTPIQSIYLEPSTSLRRQKKASSRHTVRSTEENRKVMSHIARCTCSRSKENRRLPNGTPRRTDLTCARKKFFSGTWESCVASPNAPSAPRM